MVLDQGNPFWTSDLQDRMIKISDVLGHSAWLTCSAPAGAGSVD